MDPTISNNISRIMALESQRNMCLMSIIMPVIYDWSGLEYACDIFKHLANNVFIRNSYAKNT